MKYLTVKGVLLLNKKEPYIGMPIILGDFETSAAGGMQPSMAQTPAEPRIRENPAPPQTTPQQQSMTVGMTYVPWQKWQKPYSYDEGFDKGTVFPDLYFPFLAAQGGRRR